MSDKLSVSSKLEWASFQALTKKFGSTWLSVEMEIDGNKLWLVKLKSKTLGSGTTMFKAALSCGVSRFDVYSLWYKLVQEEYPIMPTFGRSDTNLPG